MDKNNTVHISTTREQVSHEGTRRLLISRIH